MRAILPALLLATSAFFSGSLIGGATFFGALTGQATVLAVAVLAAPRLQDPFALGRRWRFLLPLVVLAVVISWCLSPFPRAGQLAVVVLPAWILLPAAVACCWPDRKSRVDGLSAIAAVVGWVALWSLWDLIAGGSTRAALPLGHHNALASWLLFTWPLGLAAASAGSPLRRVGSALSVLASWGALWATGSMAGLACWSAQILMLAVVAPRLWRRSADDESIVRRRGRKWLGSVLFVGTAVFVGAAAIEMMWERIVDVVGGVDPSARARLVYLEGGVRGWLERPLFGWGPGSVPWTIGEFLEPLPGVNPAGEVVGDLHSLPVHLAYEMGLPLVLAASSLAWIFFVRRGREVAGWWGMGRSADRGADPTLVVSGLLALGGGLLFSLTHAAISLTALTLAAAVAVGSCLASTAQGGGRSATARWIGRRWAIGAYAALAAIALAPMMLAHRQYDRAVAARQPLEARLAISRAVRRDPEFPLYRARLAWLDGESLEIGEALEARRGVARLALAAAEAAPGVGALWLAAGVQAREASDPGAAEVLARACRLDRLGGVAPLLLAAVSARGSRQAVEAGVRALAAEPALAAAALWEKEPELARGVVEATSEWPGTSDVWRMTVAQGLTAVRSRPQGDFGTMVVEMDRDPAVSLSLFAFRRRPWPAVLASIDLRSKSFEELRAEGRAARQRPLAEAFVNGCAGPSGSRSGLFRSR